MRMQNSLFRDDFDQSVGEIPVNDNYVSNYPSAGDLNVPEFIKGTPVLEAFVALLDLLKPEVLVEAMERREYKYQGSDKHGEYILDPLLVNEFTYALNTYDAHFRSKILDDEKLILIEINQIIPAKNDENRAIRKLRLHLQLSVPFAVALIEDVSFLTQRSNRFIGALEHLVIALIARSMSRNFDEDVEEYRRDPVIGAVFLRDENTIEFSFNPPYAGTSYVLGILTAEVNLNPSSVYPWEPRDDDRDRERYFSDVSPDFREIYDEIERGLQPRIQREIRDAFYVARPYNISYITGLIEGALQVFYERKSTSSLKNTKHFSSTVEAFRAAHLDLKTNYTDGDKLPEEYREQLHNLFVDASKYLADYTIKDRGFVRSDEAEIVRTDDIDSVRSKVLNGAAEPVLRTTRVRSDEELQTFRMKVPSSLKEAINEVAKSNRVSASAIANLLFAGDTDTAALVQQRRQAIQKRQMKP